MLFADDAALVSHTEQQLQNLMDVSFLRASRDFGMTISIRKPNIMCQCVEHPPESQSITTSWRL